MLVNNVREFVKHYTELPPAGETGSLWPVGGTVVTTDEVVMIRVWVEGDSVFPSPDERGERSYGGWKEREARVAVNRRGERFLVARRPGKVDAWGIRIPPEDIVLPESWARTATSEIEIKEVEV